MKIMVKPASAVNLDAYKMADSFVLPILGFAVDYNNYFTLEEIEAILSKTDKEIFVVINKMISNKDIKNLETLMLKLDKIGIAGIFFYDMAVLEIKRRLNLNVDLVWNNTHMVTNYYTCNCYYDLGVKYAYLSNEITIDEILELNKKSNTHNIFMLLGYPVVSFSKRRLVSNCGFRENIIINEPVSKQKYMVKENSDGTTFKYDSIRNNASCLEKIVDSGLDYVYLIEDDINHDDFILGLEWTRNVLDKKMDYCDYVSSMRNLFKGDSGFLFRKTIYKVKK